MSECPECHRPVWLSLGGMGGGLLADHETHCITRGDRWCRIAAAAYRRGCAAGMEEAVKVAKGHALAFCADCRWKSNEEIDWTEVDAEIERRKEE